MKLVYFIIFFFINLFSINIYSQNIAVVNINTIIDNNVSYKEIIQKIELNQQKHLNYLNIKENELKLKSKEIEDSKLILSEEEINLQIDNYNYQLSEFSTLIEEFNFHYQSQIVNIRESILKEIIKILENYAIENNVDLILDSGNYLIASNSLDITNYINNEFRVLNFNLEFKEFEKN